MPSSTRRSSNSPNSRGFRPLPQSDGSITLLLAGQTALVVGETQYQIQADTSSTAGVKIRDGNAGDITAQVSTGRLSGSLTAANQSIPSYIDGLNQLAQGIADTVNTQLAAGIDSNGSAGAALFTYDTAGDAASTLSFSGISTAQLAAAASGYPEGNG